MRWKNESPRAVDTRGPTARPSPGPAPPKPCPALPCPARSGPALPRPSPATHRPALPCPVPSQPRPLNSFIAGPTLCCKGGAPPAGTEFRFK